MSGTLILPQNRPRWAWMWLSYTGFLFIHPLVAPSWRHWLSTIAVWLVFVSIFSVYIREDNKPTRLSLLMIGATFLLGLAVFPFNTGASTFFVYTAAFIPFRIASVRVVLSLFVAEALLIAADGQVTHVGWPNVLMAIFLMVLIGGGNIFFAEQKRADCKLRQAQEENITLAAVAERERIARDLHDVLGHTLSVIVLKAELAGRLIDRDPQRAASEIADVERTARTALAEVREAIGGYRARGLLAEIEAARRTLDAAGVTLQCDALPETAAALRANEETVLALALREAVTNIVRHARATACTLRFHVEAGQHRLTVEDNGQRRDEPREGNGLRGMRERVEALGGRVSLDCTAGTRLQIALPLHAENSAA